MNHPRTQPAGASPPSSSLKSITALGRGLDVLHAIERASAVTLAELHRQTSIPKASLLRILKTLQERGWVEKGAVDGIYTPVPATGQAGEARAWRERLTSLAAQPWAALQSAVSWPTDLTVRDGHTLLVLDSHRPLVGLSINYRVTGFRPHMLASAAGRCYLSFCPEDERASLLAALARSPREVDQASRQKNAIRRLVEQVRQRGYAVRDPHHAGADSQMMQRFNAMAVPVMCGERIVACLSCAWLTSVIDEQQMVLAHLSDLQGASRAITEKLRQGRFGSVPQGTGL